MNVVVSIAQIIIGLFALDNLYSFLKHDDLSPYQGTTAVCKLTSVKFSNATFSYDDNLVLDNLNFSLPMQQTTAILGKNGSGKTSIIQLLCGFMKPQSGEVSVNDISYDQVNMASLRKQIGFVSQHPTIFNDTVFNNLTYGYEHVTMNDVRVVTQLINIDAFIQTLPMGYETNIGADGFKLSGGQRQRVALGRAIVRNAKVFLMDEPLSNLDAKLRVQMRGELIKLHNKIETTTVYVTHDQIEAMTMASRIVVMKDGYIMQVGAPKEIYDNPENMFVAGFIGTPPMNFIHGKIQKNGYFTAGDHKIKIPEDKLEIVKQHKFVGKEIVLGIRPEDIHDDDGEIGFVRVVAKPRKEMFEGEEDHAGVECPIIPAERGGEPDHGTKDDHNAKVCARGQRKPHCIGIQHYVNGQEED